MITAIVVTTGALIPTLSYFHILEHRGFFESGQFATTVIRAKPMHMGNTPTKNPDEFFGSAHSLFFDAPNVDNSKSAVLTFELADVRAPRYMELNGKLLPAEPEVKNTGYDSFETVFVTIEKDLLKSSGNELHIKSLAEEGQAATNIDDFIIRNIAVLYKTD